MIELRRPRGQCARVGHRGASALAPENTLRAFELAVELGCDMLEFDVLPNLDGSLVLAHSDDLRFAHDLLTLDEALAFFAERLPGVGLQVDLKRRGIEADVVAALRRHGLRERSWISGFDARSLRRVAQLDGDIPRSYTLPRDRMGISTRGSLAPLVRGGLAALGASLPRRLPTLLRRAGAAAATLHYSIASAAAIDRAHEHGAAVYVWTVNEPELAKSLLVAGVDGIITDDPRIFSTLTT